MRQAWNRGSGEPDGGRREYRGQGDSVPLPESYNVGNSSDSSLLVRERDAALAELAGLRDIFDQAVNLLFKNEQSLNKQDAQEWKMLRKYIQANPSDSNPSSDGLQQRVETIIQAATKDLKHGISKIRNNTFDEEYGDPESVILRKQLEEAERLMSREICLLVRRSEIGRTLVQRDPGIAMAGKGSSVKNSTQQQPRYNPPAHEEELDSEFLAVKRNLNHALEEVEVDRSFDDGADAIKLEDFEYLLSQRHQEESPSIRASEAPHRDVSGTHSKEYVDNLLRRIDMLEDRLKSVPKQNQAVPDNYRESELLKNQLTSQDKELRALRRMNEDLQSDCEKLRRSALNTQNPRQDNGQLEELSRQLNREREVTGEKDKQIDKLRDSNLAMQHRLADLERTLFDERRSKMNKQDGNVFERKLISEQETLRRESIDKDEQINQYRAEINAFKEERKRLLQCIDKLKRDLARVLEAKETQNNVVRILETTTPSQSNHDGILETYLKQGVYRNISKSATKVGRNDEGSFLPDSRTITNIGRGHTGAHPMQVFAFLDRPMKDQPFLEKKGSHVVSMGAPSKYSVFEKNPNTFKTLNEARGTFHEVFIGEQPEKFLSGLSRITTSSGEKSTSLMVVGLKEKITIGKTVLRMFLDHIARARLPWFTISGSAAFLKVIDNFLGEVIEQDGNGFKVPSESFVPFAQAIDLLDSRLMPEEFFFTLEYTKTVVTDPQHFCFAAVRCYEELKKFTPVKKGETEKRYFLRRMLQLNFSESDNGFVGLFIDRFLSQPIKLLFSYSHLVKDYLNDQFLTELSHYYYEDSNRAFSPKPSASSSVRRVNDQAPVSPSSGLYGSSRLPRNQGYTTLAKDPEPVASQDKALDEKVREAASHVRNIFKHMQ